MKIFPNIFSLLFFSISFLVPSGAFADDRLVLNFNPDWKFIKADPTNAQSPNFNDKKWTTVSTPHTYNDTDTFDNFALPGLRGETNQWGGRTWYRKTFTAPKDWIGKKIYIEFDAIRQVGEIYLNGHLLGTAKNGFIPFGLDLTPYLQIGKRNVLAVMCDNRFMFNPMRSDTDTTASATGRRRGGRRQSGSTNAVDNASQPGERRNSDAAPTGGTTIENLQARLARDNAKIPEDVADLQADQIPWNNPQWHPAMGGIYRDVK